MAAPLPDFVGVINEHQALLRRVCRLYCADATSREDLFQEVVLQLWRAWPSFEPRAKLSTWLYRIALNVAISDLRGRTRRPPPAYLGDYVPEVIDDPAAQERQAEIEQLYRAIARLSDVEKAFMLLYLEERSYEEIADILGLTVNNARVRLHRIQEKLRTLFPLA